MRRYLFTMFGLLSLALVAGIVVWYFYQDLNPNRLSTSYGVVVSDTAPETEEHTKAEEPTEVSEVKEEVQSTSTAITIKASSLTDTQRAMLKAFEITKDEFTITDAMIACAENRVGTERLQELLAGSAPSPFEGLALVACLKK